MTPYRPPEALPQRAVLRLHPAVMLVAIASGFVMAMLDVTVVNVALSAMRKPLHASLNSLVWVVGAYTLTFAAFLLPGSAMTHRIGARNTYLLGMAWFIAASAGCGLAPTAAFLVVARLLQGVGAALLVSSSPSLLTEAFPDERVRVRVLGAWAVIVGIASGVSPLVGGALVSAWGWRSIFYLNVPFGAAGMLLACHGLSPSVVVVREAFGRQSMIARVRVRDGVFWSNNLIGFLLGMVIFGDLFLFGSYLQAAPDASPLRNGVEMLPLMSVIPTMSVVSSHLSKHLGRSHVLLAGLLLAIAGCLAVACLEPVDTYLRIAVPAVCCNAGLGLAFPALISGSNREAAPAEASLASTVLNASRLFGAFAGVAITGIVLHDANRWALRLRHGFLLFAACLLIALVISCYQRLRAPRPHDEHLTSVHLQRGNCS